LYILHVLHIHPSYPSHALHALHALHIPHIHTTLHELALLDISHAIHTHALHARLLASHLRHELLLLLLLLRCLDSLLLLLKHTLVLKRRLLCAGLLPAHIHAVHAWLTHAACLSASMFAGIRKANCVLQLAHPLCHVLRNID
jgi:hypothetical protein